MSQMCPKCPENVQNEVFKMRQNVSKMYQNDQSIYQCVKFASIIAQTESKDTVWTFSGHFRDIFGTFSGHFWTFLGHLDTFATFLTIKCIKSTHQMFKIRQKKYIQTLKS